MIRLKQSCHERITQVDRIIGVCLAEMNQMMRRPRTAYLPASLENNSEGASDAIHAPSQCFLLLCAHMRQPGFGDFALVNTAS
jgi:hypothetical protein